MAYRYAAANWRKLCQYQYNEKASIMAMAYRRRLSVIESYLLAREKQRRSKARKK